MSSKGNRVRAAITTTVLAGAATGFLAGCGTDYDDDDYEMQEENVYCVDKDNNVVDPDLCDEHHGHGGGAYFFALGNWGSSYHSGQRLPHYGTVVDPRDPAARSKAGLSTTGTVKPGSTVMSKVPTTTMTSKGGSVSGGIGSGSSKGSSGS